MIRTGILLVLIATVILMADAQTNSSLPGSRGVSDAGSNNATSPVPSSGSITGRVTTADGRPLPQARVYVSVMGVAARPTSPALRQDGSFEVNDLPAGAYTVTSGSPGYVMETTNYEQPTVYHSGDAVNIRLIKGGVITGKVTAFNNEPMASMPVSAYRFRGLDDKPSTFPSRVDRMTDDRGIYRIYGLSPGIYIVSAGGSMSNGLLQNVFGRGAPTFFPSSTRDAAAEVAVRAGEETTNVDIHYRADSGHSISGTVKQLADNSGPNPFVSNINLYSMPSGAAVGNAFLSGSGNDQAFEFNDLADGDYMVWMTRSMPGQQRMNARARVKVRGADVSGVVLNLQPLPSISGIIVREEAPKSDACKDLRSAAIQEFLVRAQRRSDKHSADEQLLLPYTRFTLGVPNSRDEFKIEGVFPSGYSLGMDYPSDLWFLRTIKDSGPKASQSQANSKAAAEASIGQTFTVGPGESKSGLTMIVAPGGATLKGRISPGAEGKTLSPHMFVMLIPAGADQQADLLRYAQTSLSGKGSFSFRNLAPGHYFVVARTQTEAEFTDPDRNAIYLGPRERAVLLKTAQAVGSPIELTECQRYSNLALVWDGSKLK
jgi:hypothetical protein